MYIKKSNKYYLIGLLGLIIVPVLGSYLKDLKEPAFESLKVVLTTKVLRDDVFQFFYIDQGEQKFDIAKSVKSNVQGSKEYQQIEFIVPRIEELTQIRLDIGTNADQDTVWIKEIKFIRDNQEITFGLDGFNNLFEPNIYISRNRSMTGSFKGKTAIVNSNLIYDPYFVSNNGSNEFYQIKDLKWTRYPYLISSFVALLIVMVLGLNLQITSISLQKIFIASFLFVLILPTLQKTFTFTKPIENAEKRALAKKPDFSLNKYFTKDYEVYYNDNFGLRTHLINWGGTFRTKLFKSSMHPELVQFGKRNWLFYNRMKGKIYKSYSRTNLLSADTLKQVVDKWEDNKRRYEANRSKYFLSFWPNKHTIYPEFLPWVMQVQIKDTISRIDQIEKYLKERNSPIKLLDVRQTLLNAKKDKLVYHKFDTHWNDYGAFLAYQYFFNENKGTLGISPKTKEDFDIIWNDYNQGELIQMLGVNNKGYFIEKNPTFTLKENKDQIEYLSIEGYPSQTVITRNKQCGNKLKVLVFRDSFTRKLIQFFSLHFYEVTYIWGHGESYVEKIHPDIIIEGYVERDTGQKIQ